LFEWTEEYQTPAGKRGILAGDVVFDCSFCEGPLQLVLPLALVAPVKPASTYRVASAVGLAAKRGSGLSIPAYPCRKSWRWPAGNPASAGRSTGIIGGRGTPITTAKDTAPAP